MKQCPGHGICLYSVLLKHDGSVGVRVSRRHQLNFSVTILKRRRQDGGGRGGVPAMLLRFKRCLVGFCTIAEMICEQHTIGVTMASKSNSMKSNVFTMTLLAPYFSILNCHIIFSKRISRER